jgi:DNA invertase Pin-like site-specific DNA recombinase
MRAAVYARYSSDLQRPASIDDQERRCREEIARRGWQEVAGHSDAEIAGTVTQRRPGYQRLLTAARAREFDVVVVDELSRLTRDSEEQAGLRKRLQFWGVHLRTLDGIDTVASPQSAAPMMLAKAFVNEAESEANAHRSRRGLAGRVLAGQHAGGAPYGYRTRPVHADKPGDPPGTGPVIGYEYLIHDAEAETIRRAFGLYAEGMSTRRIAALLNAEGVLPPGARWRDRQGARRTWSYGAIHGDPTKGLGILNQEKYIGRLIWNRTTWPRDPERDGKQVRRELPHEEWVIQEAPALRIVPQELWEAVKARQAQRSSRLRQVAAVPATPRLLSGLLVCGRCGARYVLRGRQTYCCASRQNRGNVVCDCMATVNAAEAEQAILDLLEPLFCSEEVMQRLVAQVRDRLTKARARRSEHRSAETQLKSQLAKVQTEIGRLVDWIAKGTLVDDLESRMQAAQEHREHLRRELAKLTATGPPTGLELLPSAVRKIVADLRGMLAAGQTERVKSALSRLVTRIEVHEDPRPGRKRPGAKLVVRGSLEALLQLTGAKVTSGGSPGGLRTLVTIETPAREYRLQGRWYRSASAASDQRQAAYAL